MRTGNKKFPFKKPKSGIKITVHTGVGHHASIINVTGNSIEIHDAFPNAIQVSSAEWKRLMRLHKSIVKTGKEWRPTTTPMPEDRMAHHFGTLFLDHGLSYFVSRIGSKGTVDLKRYDGKVEKPTMRTMELKTRRWFADVTIPAKAVMKINDELLAQERSKIRSMRRDKL